MIEPASNSNSENKCDFSFKLVLVGDSGVGKSVLLNRLIEADPNNPSELSSIGRTVGVDFKTKAIRLDKSHVRVGLHFSDTSGAECFRHVAKSYFYNVQAFLVMYDVNDMHTFSNCKVWLDEIVSVHSRISHTNTSTDLIKILVGCKSDLSNESQRAVASKKAKKFAKQNGFVLFHETSGKTGLNVRELFDEMCLELIGNYLRYLNYQQSLIDFVYRPYTDKSFMLPGAAPSLHVISTKFDVCFNCQTESLNCNHIILNNLNSKRKNLQNESYNFFDFSFFE
jgi:small GTP-binding protein